MTRGDGRSRAGNGPAALELYEFAFLAGGGQRVAECAITALAERGALSLRAGRVRAVGEERPGHPIERAVVMACTRSRRVHEVVEPVQDSPEVDELARRLVALGLLGRHRRRATRRGRRLLAAAAVDGTLPAYVSEGPSVLEPGPVRGGLLGAHPIPSGLGRSLIRMGKALDHDRDHHSHHGHDHDGGFGCGDGGGGGGGSD